MDNKKSIKNNIGIKESTSIEELFKEEYLSKCGDLKNYILKEKKEVAFLTSEDVKGLKTITNKRMYEQVKECVRVADEVSDNTFLFCSKWDMERTSIPYKYEGEIQWNAVPFKDPEWSWMLNRHRYWMDLGVAYAHTGDEKYVGTIIKQLVHWIDNCKRDAEDSNLTWRSIEAGIRIENWIRAFELTKDSELWTEEILIKFITSLREHGEFIYNTYSGFNKASNWGVLENRGLFLLSVYFKELKESKLWMDEAIRRLEASIKVQVMGDGMHWEDSSLYHNEVMWCYMSALIVAKNNHIEMPDVLKNRTKEMTYASIYYMKPNGHEPLKGDSDDVEIKDLISTSAILFNEGEFKKVGYEEFDLDCFLNLGSRAMEEYKNLKEKDLTVASKNLSYSGNYIMRNSWDEDSLYLNFHCGSFGGGHDHGDMFNIDVYGYGDDLLSDSGRYTYTDTDLRYKLKNQGSHNVILMDDSECTTFNSSWGIDNVKIPLSLGTEWISNDEYDYVEGSHDGYLDRGVVVRRKILFVKPYYFVVIDQFLGKGRHKLSSLFHVAEGNSGFLENSNIYMTKRKDKGNMAIIPVTENVGEEGKSFISRVYNSIEERSMVKYSIEGEDRATMVSLLYPMKKGETKLPEIYKEPLSNNLNGKMNIEDNQAICFNVKLPNGEKQKIFICTDVLKYHTQFYTTENHQLFSNLTLIKYRDGKEEAFNIK